MIVLKKLPFDCNNFVSFWTLRVEINEKSKCKYGYRVIQLIVDVTLGIQMKYHAQYIDNERNIVRRMRYRCTINDQIFAYFTRY